MKAGFEFKVEAKNLINRRRTQLYAEDLFNFSTKRLYSKTVFILAHQST